MIAELFLILDLLGDTVGDTPISPPPTGQTFGEALIALTYPEGWDADFIQVNLTDEQIAIYKEAERVKKALRGL
jgi:hypothetical protein